MKKTTLTKAVSAVLCVAASVSFAACEGKLPGQPLYSAETSLDRSVQPSIGFAETEAVQTSASATAELNYDKFVEGFKEAIKAGGAVVYTGPGNAGGEIGISTTDWTDSFSYILYDIDGDGTDECIIGEEYAGQEFNHVRVLGIVTIVDGKYKIVFGGSKQNEAEFLGEKWFLVQKTDGTDAHESVLYEYNSENKCLDLVCACVVNGSDTSYYGGLGGDTRTEVLATGQDALDKFDETYKAAEAATNDLLGREWTKVAL